jgi:hypothetical protein
MPPFFNACLALHATNRNGGLQRVYKSWTAEDMESLSYAAMLRYGDCTFSRHVLPIELPSTE